jgi:hypothetical protein
MFQEHSLTGVGVPNFAVKYFDYQHDFFEVSGPSAEHYKNIAGDVRFAFNDFLQILCEDGIAGFSLFGSGLCLLLIPTTITIRQTKLLVHKVVQISLMAAIISLLVSGIVSYALSLLPIKIHFWIFAGFISASITKGRIFMLPEKKWLRAILSILLVTISGGLITYGIKRKLAYTQITAQESLDSKILLSERAILGDNIVFQMRLANAFLNENRPLDAIKACEVGLMISPSKQIYFTLADIYAELKQYGMAEKCYKAVYLNQPALLEPKYFLAKLYHLSGQKKKWNIMAREVLSFTPKVTSFHTIYMQQEIRNLMSNKVDTNTN